MEQVRQNAAAALTSLVDGFRLSQALHVAATLGIAELLRAGPARATIWRRRPAPTAVPCTGCSGRWPAPASFGRKGRRRRK
jgi:hypothetical protein